MYTGSFKSASRPCGSSGALKLGGAIPRNRLSNWSFGKRRSYRIARYWATCTKSSRLLNGYWYSLAHSSAMSLPSGSVPKQAPAPKNGVQSFVRMRVTSKFQSESDNVLFTMSCLRAERIGSRQKEERSLRFYHD